MSKSITIKELIEKLNQFDENALVSLEGYATPDFVEEVFLIINDKDKGFHVFNQDFN